MGAWKNAEWLRQKYWDENWSQTDIANFCDVSQTTIWYWLIKLSIPIRTIPQGLTLKLGELNPYWRGGGKDYYTRCARRIWKNYYLMEIPTGMDCHHIDGDKGNNDIDNLVVLPHDEHMRLEKTGKKRPDVAQWNRTRKTKEERYARVATI